MARLDPAEQARRIRAAEAYAGKTHKEIAAEIAELDETAGITETKLKRWVGDNAYTANRDELAAIAEVCSVPERFMLEGFAPMEEMGIVDRLSILERMVNRINERLSPEESTPPPPESFQPPPSSSGRSALNHERPAMPPRTKR